MIKVTAHLQTYWQISTGRGAGHYMDSLIDTDENGLPYVSGRTLKGLFKDAVLKIDTWQNSANNTETTERLFGSATQQEDRNETQAGALCFSRLSLSPLEIKALNQEESLKLGLFSQMSSTKIEHATGVATDKSLRTNQVAHPLTLQGEITLTDQALHNGQTLEGVLKTLQQAQSFITHIGSKKSRGYGQVTIELTLGETA